ncbi:MAG: hypothetical protein JWN91_2331 [Nocardioides sp.]|nr:hypothetical protein [Nocardioides sp.]
MKNTPRKASLRSPFRRDPGGLRRPIFAVAAGALVGAVLPVSASAPAQGADEPAFSGFSAVASAAPVKIEIYEPTIPIPATPQLEFEMAYTTVEADSGSSMGRASWLWPGDSVGEGAKTVIENLGLPEELSGPLAAQGYPVQVNANQPSGEATQADEPFPGTVMRASAGDKKTVAQVGYSPDSQVQDGTDGGGNQDGDEGTPGVPELPGVPGLPGIPGAPGTDLLAEFGQAITGSSASTAEDEPGDDSPGGGAPGVPPELAALVDFEGYTSSSQNVATDSKIVTTARSALGDVSLLGGIITLDGIVVTSSSSSDGVQGKPTGQATLGGMTIAGQAFRFGPDGFDAAGQHTDIPGLPDDPAKALHQLGVKLTLPEPGTEKKADEATSDMSGLQVEIDTSQLRKQLDAIPLADLVAQVPDDAGELKSVLQAAVGLSPRIVITLGNASTTVDTVQGIDIPTDVPDNDPGDTGGTGGTGGGNGGTPTTGGGAPSSTAPGGPSGDAPSADGDLGDAALAGSGLPPLYSIPGAILAGGIALAAVGGTWLRKIGVLTLGGAGSCAHGLDSGLPDLRKA